ncbi:MAG: ATP-binding protein [Bacteroidia bacterium]
MEHDHNFYSLPSTHLFSADSESPLMNEKELRRNVEAINEDINVIRHLFNQRLTATGNTLIQIGLPAPDPEHGPYAKLCHGLSAAERILLLFTLLPHYAPEILRELVEPVQQGLIITNPHLGGYVKRTSQQFIPTLQTILFVCAGTNKADQQLAYRELVLEGSLLKKQIVTLRSFENSEPVISDKELIPDLAEEYVHYILQGRQPRPDFGKNFPAKILVTEKNWDQLVLNTPTRTGINLLIDWVENGVDFSEQTKGYFNPGYPALFYGPPGTGKSLSAALIGKHCGLNVFRVDASRIVSKYIGETEKNLVALFERMKLENDRESKKPILFFDEADVLFSKRTEVKDAKDKWANMETSVLLPLIEEYGGLVIVATNLEYNLDPAMDRRFQLKIKFPALAYNERVMVWEKGLPPAYSYPTSGSAQELARYKLSPASIINVLKGGCMQAHKRGSTIVTGKDMEYFISLEFAKSGLTPSWENKHAGYKN